MSVAGTLHPDIKLITVKTESTPCTDAVPTPALDALLVESIEFAPQFTEVDLKRMRDTHSAPGKAIGPTWYAITITAKLAGPPAGGDLDEIEVAPLLQACGLTQTDDGPSVTTYTYTQDSTSANTCTIYMYIPPADGALTNWRVMKAVGCQGSYSLSLGQGGEGLWTFEMQGVFVPTADIAAPTGTLFAHEDDHTVARGHTLTIDSQTDFISELTINSNNTVRPVMDMAQTYGVAGFRRTIGKPTIEHNAHLQLVAGYDREAKVLNELASTATLVLSTVDGADYTFTAANLQHGSFSYDSADDVMRVNQNLYPRDTVGGSGDDSLTFTVTH